MSPLKIAVISDLHVGNARGSDLNPKSSREVDVLVDDYVERFVKFIKGNSITADYLVVPGDVSHGAEPRQIKIASGAIERFAKVLDVPLSNVLFVPGNHDVNWGIVKLDMPEGADGHQYKSQYHMYRYVTFSDDETLFPCLSEGETRSIFEPPFFRSWAFDDLVAVGYNSSWDDGPIQEVNCGKISEGHLSQLESHLSKLELNSDKLAVFIVHHHPVVHSDVEIDDYSTLQNADKLLDLLHRYQFDIVIHGHKHQPRLQTHFAGVGNHMLIICAGSFSSSVHGFPPLTTNQFHLLHFDERDHTSGCVLGAMKSWIFTLERGWIRSFSTEGVGVDHEVHFGAYPDVTRLVDELKRIIEQLFETKQFMQWHDIVNIDPKMKRVPNKQKELALLRLSGKLGFEFMKSSETQELVIFKETEG